jgi:FkbH-like protein/FkbM family methyltransferase
MVVVPGSFFLEMAAILHSKLFKQAATRITNIKFLSPVILSAADTVMRVDVTNEGTSAKYRFYEKTGARENVGSAVVRNATTLDIPLATPCCREASIVGFSTDAFQSQAQATSSSEFYDKLRQNGNQYGPAFQKVNSLWRGADEVLGRISGANQSNETEAQPTIHPILLDSATQLLSTFVLEQDRTFVLQSVEEIELSGTPPSESLWGHAQCVTSSRVEGQGLAGNIRVFDGSGKVWARLNGVTIGLLEPVRDLAEDALTFVVASNFTAEPVEDSIRFWADHFGMPVQLRFAPYNQVFQQVLDPESALRKNRSGANVILLALEEWAAPGRESCLRLATQRADECFKDRKRYILPNGLEIVHLNAYETDYVYKEVFEDECYLRHGVILRDGATVVDIGANIGLFSLFVMSRFQNSAIYAFEPAPVTYDLLKANCDAYGANAKAYNLGVSDKSGTAPFTFYEDSSVFSGFHSDEEEDGKAIRAVVRNMLNRDLATGDSVEEYVRELSTDRLRRMTHECSLTTVSEIIRENGIESIDLLKIDAEKSELDILHGIDEQDWRKIRQIVIEIHDPSRVRLKQIQEILVGRGYRCTVEEEELLAGSGLLNLYATRCAMIDGVHSESWKPATTNTATGRSSDHGLERNVREFCVALRGFMKESPVPLVLCLCPRTPAADADAQRRVALDDLEQGLLAETAKIANVAVIPSAALLRRYPVIDCHDAHAHQAGHVPYTPEGYAAIGTALFRALSSLKRKPFKVIVLDCDNTLWKGVCGEDGPLGIEITKSHSELQEFMLAQMRAGMLLCLCSKNNEQDVLEVLEQRSDMLLRREHLTSWRINWNRKSENIRALAHELNLGLDSFVFLDDDPVECADVRINCPGVLTLQLPRSADLLSLFLQHIWAFDQAGSTPEDQSRTRMYQENAQRERFRDQTVSLRDFIEGLQLCIEITEATEEEIGRISQLTFRTNQFNFTTLRRSESDIRSFLDRKTANCLVVRVADRFGDYGLVGVAMYETEADRYSVDTFLLSCRVLGRGVEHAVLRNLGQRALREGKAFVKFAFRRTDKNLPALEFLESLDAGRPADCTSWTLAAERVANLAYNAGEDERALPASQPAPKSEPSSLRPKWEFDSAGQNDRLQEIGEQLYDIGRIVNAMEKHRFGTQSQGTVSLELGGTLQSKLASIWQRVLGRSPIGLSDNFFEAGGTSLKAVRLVATIKKELKQSLSIANVFEYPTLNLMAARLSAEDGAQSDNSTAGATLRGLQRRSKTARNAR